MSEILIFSDSHGNSRAMYRVLSTRKDVTHVFFCGDGLRDLEEIEPLFPKIVFVKVRGNCDSPFHFHDVPEMLLFDLFSQKILLMHGHLCGVKSTYGVGAMRAKEAGAEILIFGHTHLPYEGRFDFSDRSVMLFNPGSIGMPSQGHLHYGVLTVKENGYLFSHGSLPV